MGHYAYVVKHNQHLSCISILFHEQFVLYFLESEYLLNMEFVFECMIVSSQQCLHKHGLGIRNVALPATHCTVSTV